MLTLTSYIELVILTARYISKNSFILIEGDMGTSSCGKDEMPI